MSIILGVVQQYVLEKVCDLTCDAALNVLRIWTGAKLKEKGELDKPKMRQTLKKPAQLVALPSAKVSSPEIFRTFKLVERDIPRFNSGYIDPPRCSSMRVCRDSYFS